MTPGDVSANIRNSPSCRHVQAFNEVLLVESTKRDTISNQDDKKGRNVGVKESTTNDLPVAVESQEFANGKIPLTVPRHSHECMHPCRL